VRVAGIDLSTHAVDVVLLEEDSDAATWDRFPLQGDTALRRTRSIREALPGRSWWEDQSVYLMAIEYPAGRFIKSLAPLFRIQGAIIACLPVDIELWELPPGEWKRAFGLPGSASKEEVFAHVANLWSNGPLAILQDTADAYGIAYAARRLNQAAMKGATNEPVNN
jgi:hypothetical protein